MRFSRAVVDAGADLVVGHGPHVLRGMEWHKKRLIAYSLGNFAGYKVFDGRPLSTSAILRITRARRDVRDRPGRPHPPRRWPAGPRSGRDRPRMLRSLSREDFGSRAVKISADGILADSEGHVSGRTLSAS